MTESSPLTGVLHIDVRFIPESDGAEYGEIQDLHGNRLGWYAGPTVIVDQASMDSETK